MSGIRERLAEQMVADVLAYVTAEILPGADLSDPAWQAMEAPDRAILDALASYGRGGDQLRRVEAVGVRYVEAWEGVAG